MKKISKIGLAVISMISMASAMAQSNVSKSFEASANMESFCSIQTNDINFGVVSLPLTAQSANAQMNVLCSNTTAYKVDLEYGETYVVDDGTSGISGVTAVMSYKFTDSYEASSGMKAAGYRLYKDGQPIGNGYPGNGQKISTFEFNLNGDDNLGDFVCNSATPNQIFLRTLEAAQLVNGNTVSEIYVPDTHGLCDTGRVNQTNLTKLFTKAAKADKGVMTGTFKGENLVYQVTLPSDSSKPWIAGVNSYEAIGTGSKQVIEMNAKLVPEASSSSYIAADTYLDTITATVSY